MRSLLHAIVFATAVLVLVPALAFAAEPSPSAAVAGDTRSAGEGPGLVGAPLAAILIVLALGLGTALITLLYVRLSKPPEGADRSA